MQSGIKVFVTNVHTAAVPTMFPNPDPKRMKAVVPAMKNLGKNAKGESIVERIQLVFWRKYAEIAALMLPVGTCLNVEGELHTFTRDSGVVNAAGKKIYETITTVNVRKIEFAGMTKKQIAAIINAGIARAKAEGLIPQQCVIGADYLFQAPARPTHRPYNPNEVLSTGSFGYAKVFVKGQGWLGKGQSAPATTTGATGGLSPEELQKQIAALEKQKADLVKAGTAAAGAVNPFGAAA